MTIFRNKQWAVTKSGMHTIGKEPGYRYEIERSRLTELATYAEHNGLYDWVTHLADKTWINYPAFVEAFRVALRVHEGKYKPRVDPDILERSIIAGRATIMEHEAYALLGKCWGISGGSTIAEMFDEPHVKLLNAAKQIGAAIRDYLTKKEIKQ